MSNPTLYLIQSQYGATAAVLKQLKQIFSSNDQVVFMGESVLVLNDLQGLTDAFAKIAVLDTESELLAEPINPNIQIISYDEFAALCLQFTRCISMK
ncbi:sulfur relay protein TusB [Acinetobacter sp. NCu2D-2]|uniref:sulfur relay protein TusB n=1 Tax=Acinetobacter sp. NCu2D-2 TaxID=1608473 RepID=UPI0007CDFAD1|nr:sulfur relay protein TusB [Acinetobacter sp. NCu2D-2]ANF81751.1 sulfur relay protein TusB [Acinetobacter sp. NCu2D-2]